MRRALTLARRGEGHTRPNPPVGAVLVKDGRIIGEGYHQRAGGPHAELEALGSCVSDPQGATLYVTLEPCSTSGRTPACTDAILRHRLARVVAGTTDPNPNHAGRGFELLRRAGLEVFEGVCAAESQTLIEPFAKTLATGLPWLTLKLALSLDGRLADRTGRSKWITGPQARNWVQQLRRRADAVMVGAGTVTADDPNLLCRLPGAGQGWRVIVDGRGRLAATHRIFTDSAADRTLIATTPEGAARLRTTLPADTPVTIWPFDATAGSSVPLHELLQRLHSELGLLHVVCEGGGKLAGQLVTAGLIDEYAFIYAPLIIGDNSATPAVDGTDWRLAGALRGKFVKLRRCGDDTLLQMRPLSGRE